MKPKNKKRSVKKSNSFNIVLKHIKKKRKCSHRMVPAAEKVRTNKRKHDDGNDVSPVIKRAKVTAVSAKETKAKKKLGTSKKAILKDRKKKYEIVQKLPVGVKNVPTLKVGHRKTETESKIKKSIAAAYSKIEKSAKATKGSTVKLACASRKRTIDFQAKIHKLIQNRNLPEVVLKKPKIICDQQTKAKSKTKEVYKIVTSQDKTIHLNRLLVTKDSTTVHARYTRLCVVNVFIDLYTDMEQRLPTIILEMQVKKLVSNIRSTMLKFPFVYGNINLRDRKDLSSSIEISEFAPWWYLGLSLLLFARIRKTYKSQIKRLILDLNSFLVNDSTQRKTVNSMINIWLQVLRQVLHSGRKRGTFSAPIKYRLVTPHKFIIYSMPIKAASKDGIFDLVDVLYALLPQMDLSSSKQAEQFWKLLWDCWKEFKLKDRFKLLRHFRFPNSMETYAHQSIVVKLIIKIIQDSLKHPLSSSNQKILEYFYQGFIEESLNLIAMNQSVLLKMYHKITNIVFTSSFCRVGVTGSSIDFQRNMLIKLYKCLQLHFRKEEIPYNEILECTKESAWLNLKHVQPLLSDILYSDFINYIQHNVFTPWDMYGSKAFQIKPKTAKTLQRTNFQTEASLSFLENKPKKGKTLQITNSQSKDSVNFRKKKGKITEALLVKTKHVNRKSKVKQVNHKSEVKQVNLKSKLKQLNLKSKLKQVNRKSRVKQVNRKKKTSKSNLSTKPTTQGYRHSKIHIALNREHHVNQKNKDLHGLKYIADRFNFSGRLIFDELVKCIKRTYTQIRKGKLDGRNIAEVVKISIPLLQVAAKVHELVIKYVNKRNLKKNEKWEIFPQLIPRRYINRWFIIAYYALVKCPRTVQVDRDELVKLINDVLHTIVCIHSSHIYQRQCYFKNDAAAIITTIASVPWMNVVWQNRPNLNNSLLPILKTRRLVKGSCHHNFLQCFVGWTQDQDLHTNEELVTNCIHVLRLKICCIKHNKYVVKLIGKLMSDSTYYAAVAPALLELIAEVWWPTRLISWSKILLFMIRSVRSRWWELAVLNRMNFVKLVVKAIVKLPCIYSSQQSLNTVFKGIQHFKGCALCDGSVNTQEDCVPGSESVFDIITKLMRPFLELECSEVRILLLDILVPMANHMAEYSSTMVNILMKDIISFPEPVLFQTIQKVSGVLLQRMPSVPVVYRAPLPSRLAVLDVLWRGLKNIVKSSKKPERISGRVIHHFEELISSADPLLIVSVIKFIVHVIPMCNNTNLNLMCSSILEGYSSKLRSKLYEIIVGLRHEIAEEIVLSTVEHFYDPDKSTWVAKFAKFSEFFIIVMMTLGFTSFMTVYKWIYPAVLKIVVPRIYADSEKQFILFCMTYQSGRKIIDILNTHFPHIYGTLIDYEDDILQKSINYLQDKYQFEPERAAKTNGHIMVYDLLCYLYKGKSKIVSSMMSIMKWDIERCQHLDFESFLTLTPLTYLLFKRITGIFLHFDCKFKSSLESTPLKLQYLNSFGELIILLDHHLVSRYKNKVYAALNSLFSLGPTYHTFLFDIWKSYIRKLDEHELGEMIPQILAAVLTMEDTYKELTMNFIHDIMDDHRGSVLTNLPNLYFLLDIDCEFKLKVTINELIERMKHPNWLKYFEFLVGESVHENHHIRYQALKKLRSVLKEDENCVYDSVLKSEDKSASLLIQSLLDSSRDSDAKLRLLTADCLSLLGALNPSRFNFRETLQQQVKCRTDYPITGPFAVTFLEELARVFQESEDSLNFDFSACCIQDIMKFFCVGPSRNNPTWCNLSSVCKEVLRTFLDSKYCITRALIFPELSNPIYNSACGETYERWLRHWLQQLINYISDESQDRSYIFFKYTRQLAYRNTRITAFLLPYAAMYSIMSASPDKRNNILLEMTTIINEWLLPEPDEFDFAKSEAVNVHKARTSIKQITAIEISSIQCTPPNEKNSSSSKELNVNKNEVKKYNMVQYESLQLTKKMDSSFTDTSHKTENSKVLFSSGEEGDKEWEVLRYKCTQTVFGVLDHLYRAVRHLQRLGSNSRAKKSQDESNLLKCSYFPLTNVEMNVLKTFLNKIPLSTLSKVAFKCEDYTRALHYFEQDVKGHRKKLLDNMRYLQRLHISLNDLDSVVGVSRIRKEGISSGEDVLESMARGKREQALTRLELMTTEDPNDLMAHQGLLLTYIALDQPHKANVLIKAFTSTNIGWSLALEESQMEILLNLNDWGKLKNVLSQAKWESRSMSFVGLEQWREKNSTSTLWNKSLTKLFIKIKNSNFIGAQKLISETKAKVIDPLMATSIGLKSYMRRYDDIIRLHILREIEQVCLFLLECKKSTVKTLDCQNLHNLLSRWDQRLQTVEKSQDNYLHILNVRKTLLRLLQVGTEGVELKKVVNAALRDCWLFAAREDRKNGNFQRASNCLLEARKVLMLSRDSYSDTPEIFIENAKLCSKIGKNDKAIDMLNEGIARYYCPPNIYQPTTHFESSSSNESDYQKRLHSKATLLYAKLCDEGKIADYETNVYNYKRACDVMTESEKNLFALGSYYDRLLSRNEERYMNTDVQVSVVSYYCRSLEYGCQYVYQSLPRLLSIWFDYAATPLKTTGTSPSSSGSGARNFVTYSPWMKNLDEMTKAIKTLATKVPMYIFLTAYSQLISRLCHTHTDVWNQLRYLLVSIICEHPHQALWMTMFVTKSSYQPRSSRCKDIFRSVERKSVKERKKIPKNLIRDYITLSEKLVELSNKRVDRVMQAKVSNLVRTLPALIAKQNFNPILIPFKAFLYPTLPVVTGSITKHEPFLENLVYIQGIEDDIMIMPSLQRPKKITLRGSNGLTYGVMCKPKDDLRKDSKVMEVNNVVNRYLSKHSDSRQRQLHVRTYAVTPLNEECGLLEWVPNLEGFRPLLLSLYREYNKLISAKDLRMAAPHINDSIMKKKKIFEEVLLISHPAMFSIWFINNFPDHQSWYYGRLRYTRTAAVMSIVGFIMGLGDRHGENILLDSSTGEVVHVDFNCLFNKGETFEMPERVPFRLTHNMVEAMGSLGTEGVFRRSCEVTMAIFRERKSIFLSILRPFVFDPLVEWEKVKTDNSYYRNITGEVNNEKAVENMKYIRHRINGTARNMTKETNNELSIEAHINYLINEATSSENLCQMYLGWAPFL